MAKTIRIFTSFEEQEMYFLNYFHTFTPSERWQALAKIQKKNNTHVDAEPIRKITIRKHFVSSRNQSRITFYKKLN